MHALARREPIQWTWASAQENGTEYPILFMMFYPSNHSIGLQDTIVKLVNINEAEVR